jgi:hypothetical protein
VRGQLCVWAAIFTVYTRLIGNFIKQLMFEHSGAEQLANAIVNSLPPAIRCQLTVKKSQVEEGIAGNDRRAEHLMTSLPLGRFRN